MSSDPVHTKNKKSLTPKLRFKEFFEGWSLQTLNEVINVIDCKHRTPEYVEEGVPVVSPGTIKWGEIDLITPIKRVTYEDYKSLMDHCSPKKGDLVFSRNQSIGIASLVVNEKEFVLGQDTVLMQSIGIDATFSYYTLQGGYVQGQISRLSGGSTFSRINLGDIRKLKLRVTLKENEQQKIASFLSAVDEKIQQLTCKKELLEQYKKGLMQHLFSGKLRFKDENGKTYPKWEEKLFEDIYSFYSTNSLSRDKLNYEGGSVKNIHYGDIHTKFRSQFVVNEEYVPYINGDVDLSKIKDENYCREGDLVIADASEDYDDIGKSIELVKLKNEKVVAGLHTFLARPDLSKIKIGFSGYLVQAPYIRMQVKKIAQGTKVLSLSPSRLGKVKLLVPCKEEQRKIASFFSALDSKIESVSIQIDQTQTFKKGLLQQMFV